MFFTTKSTISHCFAYQSLNNNAATDHRSQLQFQLLWDDGVMSYPGYALLWDDGVMSYPGYALLWDDGVVSYPGYPSLALTINPGLF